MLLNLNVVFFVHLPQQEDSPAAKNTAELLLWKSFHAWKSVSCFYLSLRTEVQSQQDISTIGWAIETNILISLALLKTGMIFWFFVNTSGHPNVLSGK